MVHPTMKIAAAARLKAKVTSCLSGLPFATPRGVVRAEVREARFGTPSGEHGGLHCWVYSAHESHLELIFAFYENFSPDDLICKVLPAGKGLAHGQGATLQFNGNDSPIEEGSDVVLCHHGLVTVGKRIARADLLERIGQHAPSANDALGGIAFPFVCGTTANIGALLDRLFVYAYAIEQAKRSIRDEPLLPSLYPRGPIEHRVPDEPRPSSQGRRFMTSVVERRAVELRAMDVARTHLASSWPEVEDVSARKPFDFLCSNGEQILHVEVKGTTLDGSVVLLTRNEVEHARTHSGSTALMVVSRIELNALDDGSVVASGGKLRTFEPWKIADTVLVPMTYACVLENESNSELA
jgi:Domain of unknown function (DUF3883)